MKILFIYNGAESLGIESISSLLKTRGHQVELLFEPDTFGDQLINSAWLAKWFSLDRKIVQRAVELKPDLIAFSAYTGNYQWCLSMARNIKRQSRVPIVFGGPHVSAVPEKVLENECVDYAVVGEGEFAMLDLVEHLPANHDKTPLRHIPNLCFKHENVLYLNPPRPYIRDLDALPFPDKPLFLNKVPILEENYLIITSRGCPFSCTYCSNDMNHALYAQEKIHVRRRSVDHVLEELVQVKQRGRAKLIVFCDDVFTSSRSWLEEFIPKYRAKIQLPFFCNAHPMAITKEIVALLKAGGCWLMTMGIQSGAERIRKEVYGRAGSNEKIIEITSYIKSQGIKLSVDHIFGAPTENEDDLKHSLSLYHQVRPDRMLPFWLTYFPKTRIIAFAQKSGVLTEQDVQDIEAGRGRSYYNHGFVKPQQIPMFAKYELLFQLRTLVQSDWLFALAAPVAVALPLRSLVCKGVIFLNAIKNRDVKFFYILKCLFAKKNVP